VPTSVTVMFFIDPAERCALWGVLVQAWVDLCDSDAYGTDFAGLPVTMQSINASLYAGSDPLGLGYLSTDSP
jgi:hypothetical protein